MNTDDDPRITAYQAGPGKFVHPDTLTLPPPIDVPPAQLLGPTPWRRRLGLTGATTTPLFTAANVVTTFDQPILGIGGLFGCAIVGFASWRALHGDYRKARRELRERAYSPVSPVVPTMPVPDMVTVIEDRPAAQPDPLAIESSEPRFDGLTFTNAQTASQLCVSLEPYAALREALSQPHTPEQRSVALGRFKHDMKPHSRPLSAVMGRTRRHTIRKAQQLSVVCLSQFDELLVSVTSTSDRRDLQDAYSVAGMALVDIYLCAWAFDQEHTDLPIPTIGDWSAVVDYLESLSDALAVPLGR